MKYLGGNEMARCSLSYMSVSTGPGQNIVRTVQHEQVQEGGWSVRVKGAGNGIVPPPFLRGQNLRRGAALCPLEGTSKGQNPQIVLLCG